MEAQALASIATGLTTNITSNIWAIIYAALTTISFFFLYEENGEGGWKRFIPIYGDYIAYKLFYGKGKFVLLFISEIIIIVSLLLMASCGAYAEVNGGILPDELAICTIGAFALTIIAIIVIIILTIGFDFSICKKHGKKGLFVFGMVFFTPLFLAALAWENRKKLN